MTRIPHHVIVRHRGERRSYYFGVTGVRLLDENVNPSAGATTIAALMRRSCKPRASGGSMPALPLFAINWHAKSSAASHLNEIERFNLTPLDDNDDDDEDIGDD